MVSDMEKWRVRGRKEEGALIQQRWSWRSVTVTAGGGARDSGEGLGGQEVTCGRVFIKQAEQRQAKRRQPLWQRGSSRPHRRHQRSFPLEFVCDPRESTHFYHQLCPWGTHPLTGAPLLLAVCCNRYNSSVTKLSPPESKSPERHDVLV